MRLANIIATVLLVLQAGVDVSLSVCPQCRGDKTRCGQVAGLYTKPHLPPGVNLITTIPRGSCNLNISLLRPHNNHLVIKLSDGEFIINDPEDPSESGEYEVGDTVIFYTRGDGKLIGENIISDRALDQPVQLALLVSDINYGVEYKFLAPVEKKSRGSVRRGRERTRWRMKALGPCSQSCGGGQQTQVAECVRGERVVADTKCAGPRPSVRTVTCARRPCPPAWQPGDWGACSASCGPGLETRGPPVCRQKLSHSVSIPVSPSLCPASTPPGGLTERWCEVAPCHHSHVMATQPASQPGGGEQTVEKFSTDWVVQPWGPCSVSCGAGVRERKVHCAAQDSRGGLLPDSQCSHLTRPASEQFCEEPQCLSDIWLVGPWAHCSAACGHGKQHRKVTCLGHCDEETRPRAEQDCEAAEECGEEWLTGRWSVCSHTCGPGIQSRTVHCVLTNPATGQTRLAEPEDCGKKRRPKEVRRCHLQHCGPEYFTTEWSPCSEQCGREGFRTRTVVCLKNYKPSSLCREAPDRTETCRVNTCHSSQDYPGEEEEEEEVEEEVEEEEYEEDDYNEIDDLLHTETDTKALKTSEFKESKSEMSNEILQLPEKHFKVIEKSSVCRDKFKNCNVVVQSRLCRYSFYQSNCCSSCAKLNNQ